MSFAIKPVVGGNPATLLAEVDEVCTLFNPDSTNFVVLSDNVAAQPGDQLTAALGPGQLITLDGSTDTYGVTPVGVTVLISKYPGTIQLTGTGTSPTGTPPNIAVAVANNNTNVSLIPNPNHLTIQLVEIAMSSVVCSANTAFIGTDQIIDTSSEIYLPLSVGVPSIGGVCAPALSVNMAGVTVPPNRSLTLLCSNAPAGVQHQCSAIVSYYFLNNPPL